MNAAPDPADAASRRYARKTYCGPFDRRGWVYDDGALTIEAYIRLAEGGTCATATEGGPVRTVPCEELELERMGPLILDCALLHLVRRSEVQDFVAGLPQDREVKCDDGTPLSELGAK